VPNRQSIKTINQHTIQAINSNEQCPLAGNSRSATQRVLSFSGKQRGSDENATGC